MWKEQGVEGLLVGQNLKFKSYFSMTPYMLQGIFEDYQSNFANIHSLKWHLFPKQGLETLLLQKSNLCSGVLSYIIYHAYEGQVIILASGNISIESSSEVGKSTNFWYFYVLQLEWHHWKPCSLFKKKFQTAF